MQQEKINTKLNTEELISVLKTSHYISFGKEPSNNRLAMAWAQVSLENGQGNHIYNYNLGNIGASNNILHYKVAGSKFRSFSSFIEGGKAYWKHLNDNCQKALLLFDSGDVKVVSAHLKKCNYYKVDEKHYSNLMKTLYNIGLKKIFKR